MSLTDEINFYASAGRGGDGVVRWRREKYKPKGGPCGGDGGKGGDFYVEAIRDITILKRLSLKDTYKADDGDDGGKNSMFGKNGEDYVFQLPVGSLITNTDTGETYDLVVDGEKKLLLKGGEGGLGNEHFKSSTNQRPMQATKGKDGECGNFHVELKLIADVGFIGLPNAGKTSLLNALTNAGAKVGDYSFTTLDPNLGAYYNYVLADIPGIIEGASEGKGLGHKFLRHISRTSIILHCISLDRDNIKSDYEVVRNELSSNEEIARKKEYIILTKSDEVDMNTILEAKSEIAKVSGSEVLAVTSIVDEDSIKFFGDALIDILRQKNV